LTGTYREYPGLDDEVAEFDRRAPAGAVLDAGCGAGRDSARLALLGRRVLALDVSGGLLRLAAARGDLGPPGAVAFVRGDLMALPCAPDRLAGIWACAALVHVPRGLHGQVLAAAVQCLVPGGVLAVSMKSGARDELSEGGSAKGPRWLCEAWPGDICDVMVAAGLEGVEAVASGRGTWYVASGARR